MQLDFTIDIFLGSNPRIMLTDTSTYSSSADVSLVMGITLPSGYSLESAATQTYSTDGAITRTLTYQTAAHLTSKGVLPAGNYKITLTATQDGNTATTTKTYPVSYSRGKFDAKFVVDTFTPFVSVVDSTDLDVGGHTLVDVQRIFNGSAGASPLASGQFDGFDDSSVTYEPRTLASNEFLDAEYTVTISYTLEYTDNAYNWVKVTDFRTNTLTENIYQVPNKDYVRDKIDELRNRYESYEGVNTVLRNKYRRYYEEVVSSFTHLVERICDGRLGQDSQQILDDLLHVVLNGVGRSHTGSVLVAVDLADYCPTSGGGSGSSGGSGSGDDSDHIQAILAQALQVSNDDEALGNALDHDTAQTRYEAGTTLESILRDILDPQQDAGLNARVVVDVRNGDTVTSQDAIFTATQALEVGQSVTAKKVQFYITDPSNQINEDSTLEVLKDNTVIESYTLAQVLSMSGLPSNVGTRWQDVKNQWLTANLDPLVLATGLNNSVGDTYKVRMGGSSSTGQSLTIQSGNCGYTFRNVILTIVSDTILDLQADGYTINQLIATADFNAKRLATTTAGTYDVPPASEGASAFTYFAIPQATGFGAITSVYTDANQDITNTIISEGTFSYDTGFTPGSENLVVNYTVYRTFTPSSLDADVNLLINIQ